MEVGNGKEGEGAAKEHKGKKTHGHRQCGGWTVGVGGGAGESNAGGGAGGGRTTITEQQ